MLDMSLLKPVHVFRSNLCVHITYTYPHQNAYLVRMSSSFLETCKHSQHGLNLSNTFIRWLEQSAWFPNNITLKMHWKIFTHFLHSSNSGDSEILLHSYSRSLSTDLLGTLVIIFDNREWLKNYPVHLVIGVYWISDNRGMIKELLCTLVICTDLAGSPVKLLRHTLLFGWIHGVKHLTQVPINHTLYDKKSILQCAVADIEPPNLHPKSMN
jgi:hypothetical protein